MGATDNIGPFPIPWLDALKHHNQTPPKGGGAFELSHIYNFRGQVGRALLNGQGQSNSGETLYIGMGTDYSYIHGEYIAANGDTRLGTFSHI